MIQSTKLFSISATAALLLCSAACSDHQQNKAERSMESTANSAEKKMDNAATTTSVKTKLAADVRLSTLTSINVDSSGSTVTLTGHVPTADDKAKAETVAKSVDGVMTVHNNLDVMP